VLSLQLALLAASDFDIFGVIRFSLVGISNDL